MFFLIMSTFQLNELPKEERIKLISEFYDAISCIKSREEVRSVFRDLLTPNEIAKLSRRIQIAILLKKGFVYEEITEALGAGKDTVRRVKRSIDTHGEGYDLLFKRLKKLRKRQSKTRKNKVPPQALTLEWIRKRYPAYFGIFNLVDALLAEKSESNSITYAEGKMKNKNKKDNSRPNQS